MPGVPRTFVRVPSPTGHGGRARILSDEVRARRRGGDFSHLAPILPESSHPPPLVPDYDKDLPRIPSTSTGLWGDDAVTVSISTEMMGSPPTSPTVGCPLLPVPSRHTCEREPITEAQQIVAQYRQRHRSSLDAPENTKVSKRAVLGVSASLIESPHASLPNTVIQSGVSTETQVMNAPFRASLTRTQSPPTRRPLAKETGTTPTLHEDPSLFGRVREDGTILCDREGCLDILLSLQAFQCHLQIHLIHEGYVTPLGQWTGELNIFCLTD